MIDTCLSASLHMYNVLHRFRAGRGTGTAIMELKLAQELSSIDQDTLLLVLLNLRKAYETVERHRLLIKLEGYGAGPQLCGILETLLDCQQVVTRHNGFNGSAFPATRGTTQDGIVSPTLFDVVVDNFIIN